MNLWREMFQIMGRKIKKIKSGSWNKQWEKDHGAWHGFENKDNSTTNGTMNMIYYWCSSHNIDNMWFPFWCTENSMTRGKGNILYFHHICYSIVLLKELKDECCSCLQKQIVKEAVIEKHINVNEINFVSFRLLIYISCMHNNHDNIISRYRFCLRGMFTLSSISITSTWVSKRNVISSAV